jgi:two-component system, NarL family, response regulator NreC
MDRIRILLADDHALFRELLKRFLNSQPGMEVVSEAGTADEALQQARVQCPEIILLDITMPGPSGIAVIPQIHVRCPDSRVIMVTMHSEPSYLRAALAAGATGYVVKTSTLTVLLDAIKAAMRKETFVDPSLREIDVTRTEAPRGPVTAPFARLSERERQVLKLLAQGLRYQDVAERIGVSIKTVETYRSRLKTKLGFTNREDMVRIALESGVLTTADPEPPAK